MPLLRLTNVHLAFGTQVLLDDVNLSIHNGERIGLLGRNGAGKSTLLKLLNNDIKPDGGEIWRRPGITITCLAQELPAETTQTVFEFVASGFAEAGKLLSEFHALSLEACDEKALNKLDEVQRKIDAIDGWSLQQKVETAINMLELEPESLVSSLSGGAARRAALAKALVNEPDVLLLDEPTNHLDIPSVEWLEKYLQDFRGALVTITHDRAFLQKVANQIIELDRGELRCWQYDYQRFLVFREQQLAAEEKLNAEFDKKLAREEVWIRQGIKARRTRNEGRVRSLEKMRDEFKSRRNVQGKAKMQLNNSELSGKIVTEVEGIHQQYGDNTVINNFSLTIMRGDKLGLIGPNGIGKTTLLKILLGELKPDQGKVRTGTKIELAYFDQLRHQLDPEKSVIDNIAEKGEFVEIKGKSRHVISYLQDFLFTPDRIRQPVKALSGGEQNRLILARLFSKPANVLVLDEPTNDLDLETLELLEELLLEYDGTLLLVSHDREFLDNVVTSSLIFTGNGNIEHRVGGYSDWINSGGVFHREKKDIKGAPRQVEEKVPEQKKNKLSYKFQKELDELPELIESKEASINILEAKISDPSFYEQDREPIESTLKELSELQAGLEKDYARLDELYQLS